MKLHWKLATLLVIFVGVALVGAGCARRASQVQQEVPVAEVPPAEEMKPEMVKEEEMPPEEGPRGDIFSTSEVLQDIQFDFDRSNIRPDARAILAHHAEFLKANSTIEVLIEGHCDERGTVDYNLALGERRAASTRDYLISLGVEPERLFTISYGEERPIAFAKDETSWSLNRRARFLITTKDQM